MTAKGSARRSLAPVSMQLCAVVVLSVCASWAPMAAGLEVVALGSSWKYHDLGEDLGTDWVGTEFDDSTWAEGVAQFGYGDGDEATVVSFGEDPNNKFLTTYFRKTMYIRDPSPITAMTFNLIRDDGAVIYLNGAEVARDNMPAGDVTFGTEATRGVGGADETKEFAHVVSSPPLVPGNNIIAVEIHQNSKSSSDCGFDLRVEVAVPEGASLNAPPCRATSSCTDVVLSLGPILEFVGPTYARVRFENSPAANVAVFYGITGLSRSLFAEAGSESTSSLIELRGLSPATTYDYALASTSDTQDLPTTVYTFTTPPTAGHALPAEVKSRFLTLGNFGDGPQNTEVLAAAKTFLGTSKLTTMVLLGVAPQNTDLQYQLTFNAISEFSPSASLFTVGGVTDLFVPESATNFYFDMFSFPSSGEVGGVPSNSKNYYSFDHGDLHVIVLDSFNLDGSQLGWLNQDLASMSTYAKWLVAYSYHPPHSRGDIDADTNVFSIQLRAALEVLETAGLDVFISSGSHNFERTKLLNGFYGASSTYSATMAKADTAGPYSKPNGLTANSGTVYVVTGSSAMAADPMPPLDHPAMVSVTGRQGTTALGSFVMDLSTDALTGSFVALDGTALDLFTINKAAAPSPVALVAPSAVPSITPTPSLSSSTSRSASATSSNIPSPSVSPSPSMGAGGSGPNPSPSSFPAAAFTAAPDCSVTECSCEHMACCGADDVEFIAKCNGVDNTVEGWEVTVAGGVVLVIACLFALFTYYKPKWDEKQKHGKRLPTAKSMRLEDARPSVPNVI